MTDHDIVVNLIAAAALFIAGVGVGLSTATLAYLGARARLSGAQKRAAEYQSSAIRVMNKYEAMQLEAQREAGRSSSAAAPCCPWCGSSEPSNRGEIKVEGWRPLAPCYHAFHVDGGSGQRPQ